MLIKKSSWTEILMDCKNFVHISFKRVFLHFVRYSNVVKNVHYVSAAVAGLFSPYFCGFDKQPCPLLNYIQFSVLPF